MNIHVCVKCPLRQYPCAGPCACTVGGRDVLDHAAKGDCPMGYFAEPQKMPTRPPAIPLAGDVVEKIIKAVGADRLARWWSKATGKPCECAGRKAKLNAATVRLLEWVKRKSA